MRKNIKNLTCCFLILVTPASASSQVIYHDISPDKVLNFAQYDVNVVCSPESSYLYPAQNVKISMMSGGGWVYWQNEARVLVDGQGKAMALSVGQPIDANGTWSSNGEALLNNGAGNWVSVSNKYLAVKIMKAGQWHYGWIRMDVGTNGTYGVVKDYAFNVQPNASLKAGQTISTGADELDKSREIAVCIVGKAIKIEHLKGKGLLKLHTIDGKVVKEVLLEHDTSIDLSHLSSGLYIAQIITSTGEKGIKLIVN